MTRTIYTVEDNASAEEAAWGLTRRHIGGAPVLDSDGHLTGVLSKGDLVNPEPLQWLKREATVADLMNPDVVALSENDSALAAAYVMAGRNIHRLVVLGDNGALVGIVTTMDLVKALAAGQSFALDTDEASWPDEAASVVP